MVCDAGVYSSARCDKLEVASMCIVWTLCGAL